MSEKFYRVKPEAIVHVVLRENEFLKLQIESLASILTTKGIVSEEELNTLYNEIVADTDFDKSISEVLTKAENFKLNSHTNIGKNV